MRAKCRARLVPALVALAGLLGHAPETRAALVPPALEDRSFEDLRTELVERIPAHTPEWTNVNESDPGFTLIEFFAVIDDRTLNEIIVEYHEREWWKALPIDGEAFLGELAYSLLEAALVVALPPDTPVPEDWPKRYGVDTSLDFAELVARARAPEPASIALLGLGLAALAIALALAARRRRRR